MITLEKKEVFRFFDDEHICRKRKNPRVSLIIVRQLRQEGLLDAKNETRRRQGKLYVFFRGSEIRKLIVFFYALAKTRYRS